MPIRILVVDDHTIVRDGLRAILTGDPLLRVVAEAGSGEAAVRLWDEHHPDVTIMDERLPGISGIDAILTIRKHHPEARFVVLTPSSVEDEIQRALSAGVQAYLFIDLVRTELIGAIHRIHRGERYIPAPVTDQLQERRALARPLSEEALTPQEIDVLRLAARGFSYEEIALMLSRSEYEVKRSLRSCIAKLGARNHSEAVTLATVRGYLNV
jgi:two-component system, NarL family, response regulator